MWALAIAVLIEAALFMQVSVGIHINMAKTTRVFSVAVSWYYSPEEWASGGADL